MDERAGCTHRQVGGAGRRLLIRAAVAAELQARGGLCELALVVAMGEPINVGVHAVPPGCRRRYTRRPFAEREQWLHRTFRTEDDQRGFARVAGGTVDRRGPQADRYRADPAIRDLRW